MAGLLILLVLVVWLFACIKLSALAIGNIRSEFTKFLIGLAVFASLLISPIADDILGTRQYQKYCEASDQVKTLGTIPVSASTGLYEANGDWRLAKLEPSAHDERSRLTRVADGLVRWDHGTNRPTESVFPIYERTTKIYGTESQRLLAEFTSYHYRGGFLRRSLLDSASQCFPKEFGSGLYERLFVFQP
jgi:hypothetical protein